jgi:hypothetical protein
LFTRIIFGDEYVNFLLSLIPTWLPCETCQVKSTLDVGSSDCSWWPAL